jgi:hypothetical protein
MSEVKSIVASIGYGRVAARLNGTGAAGEVAHACLTVACAWFEVTVMPPAVAVAVA